ncbi:hemicentin-1-like [Pseudoliparis swirei]|uniref:hemicentin-1-like n=1 Tax=Pseudoliparis swirei TaxID=2059687 RepID=UPI0024BE1800|nr:hemicentin-1-like [Pseudoliparis swirei]
MCVAANEAGVVERSVALTVHSAPAITAEPTVAVDAGGTVVLDCRAEGEPTPTMEWSRKGGRRLLGDDRFSPLSNGSLRVSSAQKEDTAQYECLARNLLGSARARVTLTVRGGRRCVFMATRASQRGTGCYRSSAAAKLPSSSPRTWPRGVWSLLRQLEARGPSGACSRT